MGLTAAACGGQSATPHNYPTPTTKTPLPSGAAIYSHALCKTYFGSTRAIAEEFEAASLVFDPISDAVARAPGTYVCTYEVPKSPFGLTLTLTDRSPEGASFVCCVAIAQSGPIYALATGSPNGVQVSGANQTWLKKAAARATLPKPSSEAVPRPLDRVVRRNKAACEYVLATWSGLQEQIPKGFERSDVDQVVADASSPDLQHELPVLEPVLPRRMFLQSHR